MRRLLATLTLSATLATGATLTSVAGSASATPATVAPMSAVSAVTGSTYYINCSASSGGDGSSDAQAWNTLAAVTAHGAFLPGDRILFKRGATCKGRIAPSGSGAAGAPILISSYGSGKLPVLNGAGTSAETGTVQLTDQHDWTIQNLQITNTSGSRSTSVYRAGVIVRNTGSGHLSGITLQNLTVKNVSSNIAWKIGNPDPREFGGIIVVTYGRTSGDGFDGLTIRNNTIDHIGRSGIMVSNHEYPKSVDSKVRITGNKVSWSRGDGIVIRGSKDARIDHNTVAHAADEWPCSLCGPITPWTSNAAIWPARSQRVQIDHNEVYGTKAVGGDGEGFDVDASAVDVVVEYNYAHDNDGGGILFCGSRNAVARFNIFENNAKSALVFIGNIPAKNTQIYNNTIYNSRTSKARVVRTFNGHHGSGITVKNNLIYNLAPGYSSYAWPTKPKTSANTLVGSHSAGRPTDSRTSFSDPGLKKPGSGRIGMGTLGGYKPKHPSTFKRGVAIPGSVTRDFFGKKIDPKHPPRGAAG